MEKIKIKYFTDIPKLDYIDGKSDWIDLYCAEDVELTQGEYKLIPLGVAMELPSGYEAHVVPRSSTYKNFGIIMSNSVGIIDNSYCGDDDQWRFPAICLDPKTMVNGRKATIIHKGDRICQFRIVKNQPKIEFETVSVLGNDSRGGIGSTGVR